MKKILVLITALCLLLGGTALADVYTIDSDHAEVGFSVKHMVITNVKGAYREYEGSFEVDENNQLKTVEVEVAAKSIDTRIQKRDDHLRSQDFFEVDKFPTITFKAVSSKSAGKNKYKVEGDLKIRDVTKKVHLDGELFGPVKDPWGNQRIGIILTGQIDRKDFGLTYNKVLETGELLISDEVKIHLEGEGILKK